MIECLIINLIKISIKIRIIKLWKNKERLKLIQSIQVRSWNSNWRRRSFKMELPLLYQMEE